MHHLHDDITLSILSYQAIEVDHSLDALILDISNNSLILTCKPSLLANRYRIPNNCYLMMPHHKYYGYVKGTFKNDSLIGFLGSASMILYNVHLEVGESVCVELDSEKKLSIATSMDLEYQFIYEYIEEMNRYLPDKCKIGAIIKIDHDPIEVYNDCEVFNLEDGWTLFRFISMYSDTLPEFKRKRCCVLFVDPFEHVLYGTIDHTIDFKHFCCHATIKASVGNVILAGYQNHYFLCRKPYNFAQSDNMINISTKVIFTENNDVLVSVKPLITDLLFIGLIEHSIVYDTSCIDCIIDDLIDNWIICSHNNAFYLLHKSQVRYQVYIGMIINGMIVKLKGFTMLVTSHVYPLLLSQCREEQVVVGVINQCSENDDLLVSISPFIDAHIHNASMLDSEINGCLQCIIVNIEETNVICKILTNQYDSVVVNIVRGQYYLVRLDNGSTSKLDICDIKKKLEIGEKIQVFSLDNEYVAPKIPTFNSCCIGSNQLVYCYVYAYDERFIYVHVQRCLNGKIPSSCYQSEYYNIECISPPPAGAKLYCRVLGNNGDLILSKRLSDLINSTGREKAKDGRIYRAEVIINGTESWNAYIDVIGKCITFCTPVPQSRIVYVRCIDSKHDFFEVASTEELRFSFGQFDDPSICPHISHIQCSDSKQCDDTSEYSDGCVDTNSETDVGTSYAPIQSDSVLLNSPDYEEDITEIQPETEQYIDSTKRYTKKQDKDLDSTKRYTKKQDKDLDALRPVYLRRYISRETINPKRMDAFLHYLRTHDVISNYNAIASKVHLDPKTIKKWHEKILAQPQWSPCICKYKPTRRAMDDILEGAIAWYIYSNYLKEGYQFNDQMCRYIALAFWRKYSKYRIAKKFTASYKWVSMFKKRYRLVNRRVHYHRRSIQTPSSVEQAKQFYDEMVQCYEQHKANNTLHCLINIDETSWKIGHFGDLTWAKKGVEHVEFSSSFNEKESISAIAAITASPDHFKLPLCIIREGITEKAKKIFSSISEYLQIELSANGWSTIKSFANYLLWLRIELNERYKDIHDYTEETEIDIILDLYASHRNDLIKELAKELHFKLHYIPSGLTDSFQPLDRYIFGCLKSMARAEWYKIYILNPDKKFSIADACAILIKCWNDLSIKTQLKAWYPYSNSNDTDIDSLIYATDSINFKESDMSITREDIKKEMISVGIKLPNDEEKAHEKNEEEDEGGGIDYDLFKDLRDIPSSILTQINIIIAYEEYLKTMFNTNCFIKPIINDAGTCYANTTIQLISIIPGIREQLLREEPSDIIKAYSNALHKYDQHEEIIEAFSPELYMLLEEDIAKNFENLLSNMKTLYGVTFTEFLVSEHTIHLFPQPDGKIDMKKSIDDFIMNRKYEFNKVILFNKAPNLKFDFPDLFKYDDYIFILKAAVANKDNKHFYLYIRDNFTSNFLLVNDSVIKEADTTDVNNDDICHALFYIFEYNTVENDIPVENIEKIEDITMPDGVVEIMQKISAETDDNKATSRQFTFTTYSKKNIKNPCAPMKRLSVKINKG